jgi:hypothetical protein
MLTCKECDIEFKRKPWGYANLCAECDTSQDEPKHMGVIIADGKTDYHFQLVRNPSPEVAEQIRSLGLVHDPRTQMRFTGKGQHTEHVEETVEEL